jgi:hypothetical protein
MAIQIQIQGTVINFPSSGENPNWAPAVIEFAQLVEVALNAAIGPYDIAAQTYNIDAYNTGGIDIPNLSFDNSVVRSAKIVISTYRTNTSPSITVAETRDIDIVYNPTGPTNGKWEIEQERMGNASISFSVSDSGQFSFITTSIGSGTHTGILSFSARALTQS